MKGSLGGICLNLLGFLQNCVDCNPKTFPFVCSASNRCAAQMIPSFNHPDVSKIRLSRAQRASFGSHVSLSSGMSSDSSRGVGGVGSFRERGCLPVGGARPGWGGFPCLRRGGFLIGGGQCFERGWLPIGVGGLERGGVPIGAGLERGGSPIGLETGGFPIGAGLERGGSPIGLERGGFPIGAGLERGGSPIGLETGGFPIGVGLERGGSPIGLETGGFPIGAGLERGGSAIGLERGGFLRFEMGGFSGFLVGDVGLASTSGGGALANKIASYISNSITNSNATYLQ